MTKGPAPAGKNRREKKGSPEVEKIFLARRKVQRDFLAVYWRIVPPEERPSSTRGLFLIVSKRALPLAVDRNRAKRLLRELYRQFDEPRKESAQLAVRLVGRPEKMTMSCFKDRFEPLLKKVFA